MCANPAESSIREYLSKRKRRTNDSQQCTANQKYLTRSTDNGGLSSKRLSLKLNNQSLNYTDLLICGYMIKLPPNIQPYATQRTMIAKILISLKNKLNALIESPTGSGKTLGLLSASCAWLERYKKERTQSRDECKACHNGSGNGHSGNKTLDQSTLFGELNGVDLSDNNSKGMNTYTYSEILIAYFRRVTIYYGTRTHKQISQVVKEFSRLPYSQDGVIKHTILASREYMCINPAIQVNDDINSKCKEFISSDGIGCSYKNAMRGKYEKPGAIRRLIAQTTRKVNYVWDVEDLVEALKCSTPSLCPYFSTARVLIDDADIIFCPFSYLIDPIVRTNSGLSLKNTIVILDEAHNVEDVCREAVSFTFMERELVGAAADLYEKVLLVNINKKWFKVNCFLQEAFISITDTGNENDEFQSYLKYYKPFASTAVCVEKFLYFFKAYFRDDNRTAYIDAFKGCRSVILASGTLSPTDTFRTELGTTFQQEMEGNQIIPDEQIFAAVIPSGPSGEKLCGTYRIINRDDRFIREISLILSHVCKIIPKGVLCFFSSYRVLDQIYEYMETTGILRQIQNVKVLVLKEPRRSSLMNTVMMQYERAIVNSLDIGPQCTGALLMAVFRGKVISEGIDFTDDRARCVVTVGIPFPSAVDEQVIEKKKYNDDYCTKLQLLSGDEWYTMQAYRALNQALGRCLRHRSDWGSILMLDERLLQTQANPNAKKISRWIRKQLRPLTNYEHFLNELANFVNKMELKNS
uniref:BMA-DOG-1 n=1 Tax=Brugia malayi TaxID=6279 RepID=A0A0J9Y9W9_BRUMA|nr:BMA-DOG-1 [Brugia malayi]